MNEFIFIRHGAARGNLEKRYIGRTDEPLCEPFAGNQELPAVRDFQLFVSPMTRCVQTAERLFPNSRRIVIEDLRECDFGIFEGKTADELSSCPEYIDWLDTGCNGDIPGGESVLGFKERCCRAFLDITVLDGGLAVLITHGGVIMSILERFGYPKRNFYEYHLPNCGYIMRRYENGWLKVI